MSLIAALRERDAGKAPGRRDEAFRWTDLRGALGAPPILSAARQPVDETPARDGVILRRHAAPVRAGVDETLLTVKAGETVRLIDHICGGEGAYVRDLSLPIRVEAGASLIRLVIVEDGPEAITYARSAVSLAAGASYRQTVLAGGAKRQRIETEVDHPGLGAQVELNGAYLVDGQRHTDQTTKIAHSGRDGTSRQLIRGVATDRGRGVFQGLIAVAPGADGTDARLTHNALLLSDRAEIDAKPELEIFADDVACAHGNTVGALDEDALFYAMSRGLPLEVARRLLIGAFLGEIVERIGDAELEVLGGAFLARRLEALAS
jgi:Fe-S cluster assembly protein SufD